MQFTLNPAGADKFKRETGPQHRPPARHRPRRHGRLGARSSRGRSRRRGPRSPGRFSTQEADELSKVLRAGALPATLKYLQELTVGASLGRDSIRSGVLASAAGMAFITIFMLVYYRLSGVNAVVALTANLLILLRRHGLLPAPP